MRRALEEIAIFPFSCSRRARSCIVQWRQPTMCRRTLHISATPSGDNPPLDSYSPKPPSLSGADTLGMFPQMDRRLYAQSADRYQIRGFGLFAILSTFDFVVRVPTFLCQAWYSCRPWWKSRKRTILALVERPRTDSKADTS